MKNLFEYLKDYSWEKNILLEESNMIAEDMINESFKSSILSALAQAIFNAEKENNKNEINRKKENKKRNEEQGYNYSDDYYKPKLTNFASIFGPKTDGGKYNIKKGLQGLKWSEIKDEDFKEYAPDDKELAKLIKSTYGKKDKNADFIVMTKDNKVLNFIKAYGKDDKADGVFYFKTDGKWGNGVKEITKPYYSYQTRSMKANEVIDMLKGLAEIDGVKVMALEITDDMIKDYKDLATTREEQKKGTINYDAASLKELLNKQQSRYKTMVAEIKARKLQKDPNLLFDDIKKANDEVVALYKQVVSSPENLTQSFDMSRLMTYVSYAYESLYKSMQASNSANRSIKRAKEKGASDAEANEWGHYDRERAKSEINDSKEYLDKVNKMIEDIKKNLK